MQARNILTNLNPSPARPEIPAPCQSFILRVLLA